MLEKIVEAIKIADVDGLAVEADTNILDGLSGSKVIGALQRLTALHAEDPSSCYLEVGVFQGFTLLSVANASPMLTCYGIDNFSQFDPKGENQDIVNQRSEKLGISNKVLINQDYEDALEDLSIYIADHQVAVYFVDGPHDYRSQLMCLQLALPYLHDAAVIIVDDSNYEHVRQANRDFLVTHPEYKLIFEAYTHCHPKNMSDDDEKQAREGWWNGVNIIVRDKEDLLERRYPPTRRSRLRYVNEHIVHASKLAELAPQALAIANAIFDEKMDNLVKSMSSFLQVSREKTQNFQERFTSMNTYSSDLASSHYIAWRTDKKEQLEEGVNPEAEESASLSTEQELSNSNNHTE